MKKVFNFIFIFLLNIILFASKNVYADEYDYVYCEYENVGTRCHITFSATYKGDGSVVDYNPIKQDSFNGLGGTCTYSFHLAKDDFKQGGKLKCPTIYEYATNLTVDTEEKIDYKSSKNGETGYYFQKEYSASKEEIKNGTISEDELPTSVSYRYDICGGFDVRIINGKVNIENQKSSNYLINGDGNIDVSKYNNPGICPPIYYHIASDETQGVDTCSIRSTSYFGYTMGKECKIYNENTGETGYVKDESSTIDTSLPDITTCTGLLGDPIKDEGSPAYYLAKAFDVIKYVALVLLIVLSVMDFTGAVAKQDKDALSKILKKVMMRFILCIIIFFLPYFVRLLLRYLAERQIDLCGIGG